MGNHHAPAVPPVRDRASLRTVALAMLGLTVFVIAMIASYSGAFAKPTLHHMTVAVAAPQQFVDELRSQDVLTVNTVGDDAAARQQVYERKSDAAFAVDPAAGLKIYVAGGGGKSVATAAESVGRTVAAQAGLNAVVDDVAPASAGDPSGTVEFYAIIFISIGASVGATVLGALMGRTHTPPTLLLRTVSLAAYSALLAGCVTIYVDGVLGALTNHTWQVFGALWLYSMAVGGAITGVAAAFGAVASLVLTLFLVVVGNAAAAGPVGKPLLSDFYATFTAIVPQGSGVTLLRSIEYFGGNGATTPLVTLLVWGGTGCLLALLATASRLNYRDMYERFFVANASGDGAVLRSRLLSAAD